MQPYTKTCPECGGPWARPRKDAHWHREWCTRCRDLARRAAHNARERDPYAHRVTAALLAEFGRAPFEFGPALAVAAPFGRDAARLDALLRELGGGDFDPATGTGTPGDGVLAEAVGPGGRVFTFCPPSAAAAAALPPRAPRQASPSGRIGKNQVAAPPAKARRRRGGAWAAQPSARCPKRASEVARGHAPEATDPVVEDSVQGTDRRMDGGPSGWPSGRPRRPRRPKAASRATPSADAANGAPDPRVGCIAGPTIDGGTTLALEAPSDRWHPELARAVARARSGEFAPAVLRGPDGQRLAFEVRAIGRHVSFIGGDAQVDIYPRTGLVLVRASAEGLWTQGYARWANDWIDRMSFLALESRANVATARELGWKVRNVEVCADFTGLVFFETDVKCFTGPRRARRIDSGGFRPDGTVETIELGKRARNRIAVETHDKTAWLRKRGDGKPEASMYAPTWRAGGWDGCNAVRRVEVRGHGRALKLRTRSGDVRVDLTDPAALLDATALAAFWRHATTTSRLAVSGRSRLRRAAVDPRWLAVSSAGGTGPSPRLTVAPDPEACVLAAAARARRARQAMIRSAGVLALVAPDDLAALVADLATGDGNPDARALARVGHLVERPAKAGSPDGAAC
jgi:hypothetical protein